VINLSLGHPIYEPAAKDPLVRAVEAASRAGIIVVAAAGNQGFNAARGESGYGGIVSPGNAPSAITVGALMTKDTTSRDDDEVAPYSSRGPSWYDAFAKPDIVAPGHGLVSVAASNSTLYTNYPTSRAGTNYLRLSGTSMAAGVASGTVALLLEANKAAFPNGPPLTPNAIKAMLQYSSLQVRDASGVAYDQLTQGAGALNAAGAIDLARTTRTATPVGSNWWTTSVTPSSKIGGVDYMWSEHIVWGSHIVWGTSIATNEAEWGLDKTWGSSAVWESHIVWGTDVVWASPHSWATHIVWGTNFIGAMSERGDHIVWGTAEDPKTTVWGNLADAEGASP
jgi:serine protease AprX